jgi:predicted 3-demethylubiquinone-9 3-methyltransferase (glyoxalase superfamily)
MSKIATFLMFVGEQCGKAEEAIHLYTTLIPESEIKTVEYWGEDEEGGISGQVKRALFTLSGQEYMASENSIEHQFTFTPAVSIFIECADENEISHLHQELVKDGKELIPLDDYGFSEKFCWIEDRFGVSWQLNLESQL